MGNQKFFLHRSKLKRVSIKQESEEVGTTYKVIAISLTIGLNVIVFAWFFLLRLD